MPQDSQRLGRYEILQELGRGAMGTVFRSRDPKIDRVVAIKTINLQASTPEEEKDYRLRFFREAQAAGKLAHPGIVTVYDVGEDEATHTPYIVMEFIAGRTLEHLTRAPVPTDLALDLVKQVADALDYAHQQGIIHRDIKPANIMVTEDGRAKIADFGIAKLAHSEYTMPGQILGTPCFMAPEQLKGEPVTGRSDIFSLGVILYTLLAGERPFDADSVTAITFQVAYKDPVAITVKNPSLTPDFDVVVSKSLAKDPDRRYQRGRDFARDLEDLHLGRPPRSITGSSAVSQAVPPLPPAPPVAATAPDLTVRSTVPAGSAPAREEATLVRGSTSTEVRGIVTPPPMEPVSASAAVGTSTPPPGLATPPPGLATPTPATFPTLPPQPLFSRRPVQIAAVVFFLVILLLGWAVVRSRTPVPSGGGGGETGGNSTGDTTASVGRSNLRFICVHSFHAAQFFVWLDDSQVLIGKLNGRKREFSQAVHVPGGEHTVRVRVYSRDDNYDQTRDVKATFPPGDQVTIYANASAGDLSLEVR